MRRHIVGSLLQKLLYVLLSFALLGCAAANQHVQIPGSSAALNLSFAAQSTKQQPSDRVDRPTSEPYTGSLSIFEDPKREERLQISRVMDTLGIKEGSNVADVGAGSGWFTVLAAKRVGTSGTVYAVDINTDYLKHIEKRSKDENLPNIRTILGKEDDPLLPRGGIDAVLLLKTYHEIAEPVLLLKKTREAMRQGGLLGIIDRNGKGDDHGIDARMVVKETERAGFQLVTQHDFVKSDGVDYFLVFRTR